MFFCFFFFKQKTAYEIMPSPGGSEMCIRDRFGPLPARISTGRAWLWLAGQKQLKAVRLRLGITDGQYTELLEGDLQAGADLVTAVTLGTESANRNPSQTGNPLSVSYTHLTLPTI